MRRGDLYRVYQPPGDTKQYRAFVIVSRQALIDARFPMVICAPVYTNGSGLSTQVSVGPNEGLKHESWILCDNLTSILKSALTQYVGSLSSEKLAEVNRALSMALDLRF
ncbi:MAG: type II toxin-antitoxin system PemK/MazF family toxin [Terracidiphilus sp.]|jgi:mRNA interferase MazF